MRVEPVSGAPRHYRGLHCVVTGGLGFNGSNLAIRLVKEGATVTIVDSAISGCGANPFNIESVVHALRILDCDIGDTDRLREDLEYPDVIFNVAGEISHIMSMSNAERDLDINTRAQLRFLLFCKEFFPGTRVVYASTRQVYGKPLYLPADEDHPIQPIDFNGVHKAAATHYHLLLSRRGELDCIALQLSNVYGPRMALHLPQQGVLNVYLRQALERKPLTIYGDGMQLRDPVYVDDVVDALLRSGLVSTAKWRVYNIGGPEALTMAQIANAIASAAHTPPPITVPFPCTDRSIDIGGYVSDSRRAKCGLQWEASTRFECGIKKAIEYYEACAGEYLSGVDPRS